MRMLDVVSSKEVKILQLYLTKVEAENLLEGLQTLLNDPESNKHCHVFTEDPNRDLSYSLITPQKIKKYTKLEKSILENI